MSNIIELTTTNFDDVLEKHDFLLIDFWAEWCAPCKAFSEIIKHVADDYPEVVFGGINIEEEAVLASEFNVQSIPRVLILRNRTVIYDDSGSMSVDSLKELLDNAKTVDVDIL